MHHCTAAVHQKLKPEVCSLTDWLHVKWKKWIMGAVWKILMKKWRFKVKHQQNVTLLIQFFFFKTSIKTRHDFVEDKSLGVKFFTFDAHLSCKCCFQGWPGPAQLVTMFETLSHFIFCFIFHCLILFWSGSTRFTLPEAQEFRFFIWIHLQTRKRFCELCENSQLRCEGL